jgi:2-polyprenyl-6-methoxyphenol hydroxylase-like FAD-dependent oxidoreductase
MYMILVALLTDKPANAMPIDVDLWSKTFPTLRRYIERVGDKGHYDVYHSVYPPSWHYGKCVLIGDAAHGMTPALGQGANTAMMTAYALAAAIGREVPQEGVLDEWEASMRPLVNSTQRYAEGITAGKLDPNNEIFFSDPALRSLLGVDIPRIYKEASIGSRSVVAPAAIHAE